MEHLSKTWRLHCSGYTRAFVQQPASFRLRLVLWLRGWRHTHWTWWSKPGPKQQKLEQGGDTP